MPASLDPITPTDSERNLARNGSRRLAQLIEAHKPLSLRSGEMDAEEIDLPDSVARALQAMLEQFGQGQAVVVLPLETELTTFQAADLLGRSRPFLVRLLDQGDIPFHRAGSHRRIYLKDLLAYKQEKQRQSALLDALVSEAQELNMGY